MPLYNQTLFDLILGPVATSAQVRAYSTDANSFMDYFDTYEAIHYTAEGTDGLPLFLGSSAYDRQDLINYYDRTHIYYAWWVMTGDNAWKTKADALGQFVADNFAVSSQVNEMQLRGLALHYASTGYAPSLAAIGDAADFLALWVEGGNAGKANPTNSPFYVDGRVTGRITQGVVLAHLCGAPGTSGRNFATLSANCIDQTFANRGPYADSQWRFVENNGGTPLNPAYLVYPFQLGELYLGLILYWRTVSHDSRIVPGIAASMQQMSDANIYVPATSGETFKRGWRYFEPPGAVLESTYTDADPGLNAFNLHTCAFLYQQTGSVSWKTQFDEALHGLVLEMAGTARFAPMDLTGAGVKQFNQGFIETWRAWPMVLSDPSARTIRLRGV